MLFHPARPRLTAWLEGRGTAKVDRHVSGCDRCASRLEQLAPPVADLRVALARALQPPADLVPRLRDALARRIENRQDLGLLGQMLNLPWQTTKLLFDEAPSRPEDQE